jgi:KaiC/GvpD/RAD55 family RecA-like ATPase
MVKTELVKGSPLRILEQSTHGGLGKGNLGAIAAKRGTGKTALLVHLATDQLFQGRHLIHVSFSASTAHIIDWYEDIFDEIKRRHNLDEAPKVHDEIVKNRVIMNFNQEGLPVSRILTSLKAMIREGGFDAGIIVVDGYDFGRASEADVREFRRFAQEMALEIWFSITLQEHDALQQVLGRFLESFAIIIQLKPMRDYIHLELVKDHDEAVAPDLHLKLDPKTMLVAVQE